MATGISPVSVGHHVKVTWVDSCGQNGRWEFASDVREQVKPCRVQSHGIVVWVEKEYILVAAHYCESTATTDQEVQYQGTMAIPVCCIEKVQVLE